MKDEVEEGIERIFGAAFVKDGIPWVLRSFSVRPDRNVDGPPAWRREKNVEPDESAKSTGPTRQMVLL